MSYSKAKNVGERINNAMKLYKNYGRVYDWSGYFTNFYATVKEDGTQLHFDLSENELGMFVMSNFKSHRGNRITNSKKPDLISFKSAEELLVADLKFQKIPLSHQIASVWDSYQQLFREEKERLPALRRITVYLEAILPGITPCKLNYPVERKQDMIIFELVHVNPDGDTLNYPVNSHWVERLRSYGLTPINCVSSGTELTLERWTELLDWIKGKLREEEGLVVIASENTLDGRLLSDYHLTKLKLLHADDLLSNIEEAMCLEEMWRGQELAYQCFKKYLEYRYESNYLKDKSKPK